MNTPISENRLAANRANAARSTGPRTDEGKARSAQNARTHGFTASSFAVLRIEDVDELKTLRAEAIHVYQPVNSEELFAIERIALCKLSILRAARLEAGMFTDILRMSLNDDNVTPSVPLVNRLAPDFAIHQEQLRAYALGNGLNRLMRAPNAFALFLRYQTLAERQFRRAVEEFDRLKALRGELPNEPIADSEPEETQPDTPLQNEPAEATHTATPNPAPDPTPAPASTLTFPLLRPGYRRVSDGPRPRGPLPARPLPAI